jgi:phage protein U
MTTILINCSSSSAAQELVDAVAAGELWGVDMGTTSSATSYSNYCLIQCTKTRNYSLHDKVPDSVKFSIELSQTEPDSFSEAQIPWKMWYLRGKLGG